MAASWDCVMPSRPWTSPLCSRSTLPMPGGIRRVRWGVHTHAPKLPHGRRSSLGAGGQGRTQPGQRGPCLRQRRNRPTRTQGREEPARSPLATLGEAPRRAMPTRGAAVGPWPCAASGPGWSLGSCWGATGVRGQPSPHRPPCNSSWTGCGRDMPFIFTSADNKLLLCPN